MEHAKKMILLPATRPDPTQTKMSNLDQKMHLILYDKRLSQNEKARQYFEVLSNNIEIEKHFDVGDPLTTVLDSKLEEKRIKEKFTSALWRTIARRKNRFPTICK